MIIIILILIVVWLVFGLIGKSIGASKGRELAGWWLGFMLGPIGLVIIGVMEPTPEARAQHERDVARVLARSGDTRPCPWCAETIKTAAVVCRHCGRDVPQVTGALPTATTSEQRVWFRELALSCDIDGAEVAKLMTAFAAAPPTEDKLNAIHQVAIDGLRGGDACRRIASILG